LARRTIPAAGTGLEFPLSAAHPSRCAHSEVLVHTKSTQTLETKFVTFEVRIPADILFTPQQPKDLHKVEQTREIGQQWIKDGQFAVMRAPSIINREPNYILNPLNPDFKKIEIDPAKPFKFDLRATSK
jgi:RES domain-containing protein